MAEQVLVSFTEEIVKNLVSFVAEEIKLTRGLKGDLKKLSEKLTMIQAVIRDAEKRQVEESVRLWLKKLKSIAYDAEDVLDEFAYELLRRKLEIQNRMRSKVRNFFSISNPIAFRFKMAHRVKNINLILAQIAKEATEFKLKRVESTDVTTNCGEIRQTHPYVDDSKIVGRNDDISRIVDMLLDYESEEDLSIVAIVGMGGLGKTTLAQLVYKDENVMGLFNKRMWVCVSDDFNVQRVLKEMVESLTSSSCNMSNMEGIIRKLKEDLQGKRCLLVLDDVWNKDQEKWEVLRNSLLGTGVSRGSKVMVTTRSDEVVSTMQTNLTHHLEGLSDHDSWILFKQRAFASGGAIETQTLVDIGERIVKRCGGVPLAIKTLGALMHSKEEHEWLSIQNSKLWELPPGESKILPALRLSFDHLPSLSLKQCFTYCSIFPKDFPIKKEILIQLWMAQGFLQPSQGSNWEMEEIGNNYFKILLWSSLFQDVEMDRLGNIIKCKMHDLVHDLASLISGSQCLALGSGEVNNNLEAQHLMVIPNGEIKLTIPRESCKKMRTLVSTDHVPGSLLLDLNWLRVLDLHYSSIEELPASIGKLKHLRYLDVSHTYIKAFPKSIGKLYNLQTLRLWFCVRLRELPIDLKNLINLRHIYFSLHITDDAMQVPFQIPIEVGRLTSLQTLPYFSVGPGRGRQMEELRCLNKLRGKLIIYNLEHVSNKEAAERANLLGKVNLNELQFEWGSEREGDNNDEDVLEGLQPHSNLKSLRIEKYRGDKFPSWMRGGLLLHGNLVEIFLIGCNKCDQIPTLGQIPFLRVVKIKEMGNVKCIGTEFYGCHNDVASGSHSGGGSETRVLFPSLKELTLGCMENLVEWMEPAEAIFPCLEVLILKKCPRLKTAPSHFPSLRKLIIDGVDNDMPLVNISKNLTSLRSLRIAYCDRLRYLWDGLHTLTSLEELTIESCSDFESIPSIHGLTSLRKLDISCCNGLTGLPCGLESCTSLESLAVRGCSSLKILPEMLHCLIRLKDLRIGGFSRELDFFPNFEFPLQLRDLKLYGWPKLEFLPCQLQHLTALTSLRIRSFDGLEALPEWLGNLSSLQELRISGCEKLMCLPPVQAMQRLTKLESLWISDCPLLQERCTKGSGPEWFKISHIPQIHFSNGW